MGDGRILKQDSQWKIPRYKISSKTTNRMGGRRPGGCITGPRETWMEETRMEASFEGSQGQVRTQSFSLGEGLTLRLHISYV
jgi:hypothetical protein